MGNRSVQSYRSQRRSTGPGAPAAPAERGAAAKRGGRAKRYFRVEPLGLSALKRTRDALATMWDGLDLKRV